MFKEKVYDLIVVGGGASGMMAAGRASERGLSVLILEKNKKLGEKLRISGGGRCNILNKEEDMRSLCMKYGDASPFLFSLFAKFGMMETFSFFEKKGLSLTVEAQKRVFPKSQKAEDVVSFFKTYMSQGHVEIQTQSVVSSIKMDKNKLVSLSCGEVSYRAKNFLFALGGVSHPETGSTGDGFRFLKEVGHTVKNPTASLVPLSVKDIWVKSLSGISLEEIKITFFVDTKKRIAIKGKILFTHFGISGPMILNNSSHVDTLLHEGEVTAQIDLFPKSDHSQVDEALLLLFDANKNKVVKNVLKDFVPHGCMKGFSLLLSSFMNLDWKVHSVSREERKVLVHLFKALPLTIEGLMGFDKAVVADGGVCCEEIDFTTMRSKKVSNLFVTGDLLNISRPSGGFSLQLCWSTGYVAGDSL